MLGDRSRIAGPRALLLLGSDAGDSCHCPSRCRCPGILFCTNTAEHTSPIRQTKRSSQICYDRVRGHRDRKVLQRPGVGSQQVLQCRHRGRQLLLPAGQLQCRPTCGHSTFDTSNVRARLLVWKFSDQCRKERRGPGPHNLLGSLNGNSGLSAASSSHNRTGEGTGSWSQLTRCEFAGS